MTQLLPLEGKQLLLDDDDFENVVAHKWSIRWNDTWMAYSPSLGVWLHRWLVEASPNEKVRMLNGNHLDCRRANIKLYRITPADIEYIIWLQAEGWFTQRKWGASTSQFESVARELGIATNTVRRIAEGSYFQSRMKEQLRVLLPNISR